jgi:hypothetical protein
MAAAATRRLEANAGARLKWTRADGSLREGGGGCGRGSAGRAYGRNAGGLDHRVQDRIKRNLDAQRDRERAAHKRALPDFELDQGGRGFNARGRGRQRRRAWWTGRWRAEPSHAVRLPFPGPMPWSSWPVRLPLRRADRRQGRQCQRRMAHAHQDQLRLVVHGDEGEDAAPVGRGLVR